MLLRGAIIIAIASFSAVISGERTWANGTDKVRFNIPAKTMAKRLSSKRGTQKFLVASNAPFSVISKGAIGEIKVEIKSKGHTGLQQFGALSQAPGLLSTCARVASIRHKAVYRSVRKTAQQAGTLMQQAVMVIVHHDPIATPQIKIIPSKPGKQKYAKAQLCSD